MNEPDGDEPDPPEEGAEATQQIPSPQGRAVRNRFSCVSTEPPHRVLDSTTLFADQKEVWDRHGDQVYRLRQTSSGGLYLMK